jgi:uncharacterized protein YjiS (DUF1127 family)
MVAQRRALLRMNEDAYRSIALFRSEAAFEHCVGITRGDRMKLSNFRVKGHP